MYCESENVAVNLYPVIVVARAFKLSVAILFVVSNSCGSDSQIVYLIYGVFM